MKRCLRIACFAMVTALALPANAKSGHFVLNLDCTNIPGNSVWKTFNWKKQEAYMGGMTYGMTCSMKTFVAGNYDGVQFGSSDTQLKSDSIYFNLPFAGITKLTLTMRSSFRGGYFDAGYNNGNGTNFKNFFLSVDPNNAAKDPSELSPVAETLTDYTFRTYGFKPVNGNLTLKMRSNANGWYLRIQKIDVTCDVAEIPDYLYTAVSSTSPIDYAASGLTAYGVTVKDGKAMLTPVIGIAAKNSVVLVKGIQAATYPLVTTNSTTETGTAVSSDMKISDGTVTGDGKTIFALGKNADGIVGFSLVASGTTVANGTGYVTVTDATSNFIPLIGQSVSIDSEGYATLYDGNNNLVIPTDVTANTYKVSNGQLYISKTYAEGSVIPKGTGVVLKAAANSYDLPITIKAGEADNDNMLKGSDVAETTTGGELYYMLSLNNKKEAGSIGFYWGAANGGAFTNSAHRAYLVSSSTTSAKGWNLHSATTGINLPTSISSKVDSPTYNLAGQRVNSNYSGIIIRNGKKYIIK